MQNRIIATSSTGDVTHGENRVKAVQGGFSISKRVGTEDLAIAMISEGADLSAGRWVLEKTEKPNVYVASAA